MKKINNALSPQGEPLYLTRLHAMGRKLGKPVAATFELTPRCNFDCRMCYIRSDGKQRDEELSTEQWKDIGTQVRDAGAAMVLLTGGEPLIREDFPEIYQYLKKLGLLVSVNTNASLLKGDILELFKKDPPNRINATLYGASAETYEKLCSVNRFDDVINNLKAVSEAGLQLRINMSITPDNCNELEKMLEIASSMKAQSKAAAYLYPAARKDSFCTGENDGRLSPEQAAYYRTRYDYARYGKDEYLRRIKAFFETGATEDSCCCDPDSDAAGMKCRAGSTSCWVTWKGNLNVCGMFPSEGYPISEEGFEAAWEKVKKAASSIRTPEKCVSCPYRRLCPVCAAVCVTETGSFSSVPQYACAFAHFTAQYMKKIAEELK